MTGPDGRPKTRCGVRGESCRSTGQVRTPCDPGRLSTPMTVTRRNPMTAGSGPAQDDDWPGLDTVPDRPRHRLCAALRGSSQPIGDDVPQLPVTGALLLRLEESTHVRRGKANGQPAHTSVVGHVDACAPHPETSSEAGDGPASALRLCRRSMRFRSTCGRAGRGRGGPAYGSASTVRASPSPRNQGAGTLPWSGESAWPEASRGTWPEIAISAPEPPRRGGSRWPKACPRGGGLTHRHVLPLRVPGHELVEETARLQPSGTSRAGANTPYEFRR